MGELRKDYILDRWVIIATERGQRPHQFKQLGEMSEAKDFFAPGNEHLCPPEIYRKEKNSGWQIRVFPNKFPAVKPEGTSIIKTDNKFYTYSDAFGKHEVIVETPDNRQMWDLSVAEIKDVLEVYKLRVNEILKIPGIRYVCIFKNHKKEAGTSIIHSHSQVIAYDNVPRVVQEKIQASKRYDSCPYCEIIQREKDSRRRCFENANFIAFTPYASRFPFEMLILPKDHKRNLDELDLGELADIMKKVLVKLRELNAPYNYILHYSPADENLHFQIEVLPRLTTWAGFEYSGTVINPMPPEKAAEFYRRQ